LLGVGGAVAELIGNHDASFGGDDG
jgi:hypothetical protein